MLAARPASVSPQPIVCLRAVRTSTLVPSPGTSVRVEVEGRAIAVFNVGGKLYGLDSSCPHRGCPLEQGRFESDGVTCPWHRLSFDLTTGAVVSGPGLLRRMTKPVTPYRVESTEGWVTVLLPDSVRPTRMPEPVSSRGQLSPGEPSEPSPPVGTVIG